MQGKANQRQLRCKRKRRTMRCGAAKEVDW